MANNQYDSIIAKYSLLFKVPYALIKATIHAESSFLPTAYRAEPKINDASYGLMQVLAATASWMAGREVSPSELYDPDLNIQLGTKYLAYQQKRYSSMSDVVAAYNAGSVRRKSDGTYINQAYVDRVITLYNAYLQETPPSAPAPTVAGFAITPITVLLAAAAGLVLYFLWQR